MKEKIYQSIASEVSSSDKAVSGAQLSRNLGISRVAVWKHIQQMKAAGCAIEATAKGYRLVNKPDTPFAWAFPGRSERIHYLEKVDTTMNAAMALAGQACENLTVVVADHQTTGRGRLQRAWQSMTGGLYFTMILRPEMAPPLAPLINLAAAVDLAGMLNEVYGIQARVKWPNDVLVQERKIAGILSQMGTESGHIEFVNLGVGINVANATTDQVPTAISMAELTQRRLSRTEVLESFLDRFEQRVVASRWDDVVDGWRALSITLGRRVVIQTISEKISGTAVDLDDTGALIVETSEGQRRTVLHGDCFFE